SALAAEHAGKYVRDGVDVGRDIESPPQQIIACIDDDGDVVGGHRLTQAIHKLRATCTAAEDADHAALLILAIPLASAEARNFSDSKPDFAVNCGRNSGYTGRRCCNAHPLASVRRRSCSK